jgi:DNA-binding response OmpR family regulator
MDHGTISRYLQREFQAKVIGASDRDQTERQLGSEAFDLILVNRVLDGDGTPGLDLIGKWKSDPKLNHLPVMLVSNFPDAQRSAESLGALPGFGKASLTAPSTRLRLAIVLEAVG